jgi:predicted NBD/HSP70 family sugar kinase
VQYFLDRGTVTTGGNETVGGTVGRQPEMMRFNPSFAYTANLMFEGNYSSLGIVDMGGDIVRLRRWRTNSPGPLELLDSLPALIRGDLAAAGIPADKLGGIGVGVPGVLSGGNRVIEFAPLVGVKEALDCGSAIDILSEEMGVPVLFENDVNASAWGSFCAENTGCSDLIYCSLGTGLGAGIILDGRLRRGAHSLAGEIGYISHDSEFITERSKPGWLEQKINLSALRKNYGFDIDENKSAPDNEPALVEEVARTLSICFANFQFLLDVDLIILGGLTPTALGAHLLHAVRSHMRQLCPIIPRIEMETLPEPGITGLANLASISFLQNYLREDDAT